jgi:hypothetical protein
MRSFESVSTETLAGGFSLKSTLSRTRRKSGLSALLANTTCGHVKKACLARFPSNLAGMEIPKAEKFDK